MRCFVVTVCVLLTSVASGQWQEEVRVTNDPGMTFLANQNAWSIAATGDTLHVVFVDNRLGKFHVYHTRSLDNGVNWDSATCISLDTTNVLYSALAASGPAVHIVWANNANDRLQYRRSTDAGVSWDVPETLAYTTQGVDRPGLAASGDNVYAVWSDGRNGRGLWAEVYLRKSGDGGASWGTDVRVSPDSDSTLNKEPCIAVSGDHVHAVWYRHRWMQGIAQCWYARSSDGGATWSPRARVNTDSSDQQQPVIAARGADVHVCWYDALAAGGLYYHHSSDYGATWGPNVAVKPVAGYGDLPTIAAAGRNVHIAWRHTDLGQFDIGYCHSTDNGVTWLAETLLTNNSAREEAPSLATVGPRVHLAFHADTPGNYEAFYKQNPTGSGVEETPKPEVRVTNGATIVRRSLLLSEAVSGERPAVGACLLDAAGRTVLELHDGANDVSRMSPGVYFVRHSPGAAKVLITR